MNIIRSEWIKTRSLRITWGVGISIVFAGVALGAVGASGVLGGGGAELPEPWDPTSLSLKGLVLAQVLIGMLGALGITREFDSGTMSVSVATVSVRWRLVAAKAVVTAAVSFVIAAATVALSFGTVQLMLSLAGVPTADVGDGAVWFALIAAVLYLTLVGLIGLAVGALVRSTTSALAVLVGALLLAPALGPGLPGAIGDLFATYWPSSAGQAAYTVVPVHGSVEPLVGLLIVAGTALACMIAGQAAVRVRDV